jgi:NADH dehydrogenase
LLSATSPLPKAMESPFRGLRLLSRWDGLSIIAAQVDGRSSKTKPFHYHHQGDLATIGRKCAIVSMKHLQLRGRLGWLFWSVVHIYFLIGLRNRVAVAANWVWEYLTFQRGARLIS